jgi:hypothetical protein
MHTECNLDGSSSTWDVYYKLMIPWKWTPKLGALSGMDRLALVFALPNLSELSPGKLLLSLISRKLESTLTAENRGSWVVGHEYDI